MTIKQLEYAKALIEARNRIRTGSPLTHKEWMAAQSDYHNGITPEWIVELFEALELVKDAGLSPYVAGRLQKATGLDIKFRRAPASDFISKHVIADIESRRADDVLAMSMFTDYASRKDTTAWWRIPCPLTQTVEQGRNWDESISALIESRESGYPVMYQGVLCDVTGVHDEFLYTPVGPLKLYDRVYRQGSPHEYEVYATNNLDNDLGAYKLRRPRLKGDKWHFVDSWVPRDELKLV